MLLRPLLTLTLLLQMPPLTLLRLLLTLLLAKQFRTM